MEEEIKILEEHIEFLKRNDVEDIFGDMIGEILAIENLLKRYKELEEKETEKFLKILEDNSKTMLVKEVMELRTKLQNSIPISVIQNKKKYWEQEHHIAGEHLVVQVLDEILEKGNK